MNRSLKYLFIFLFVSLVMGYVAYWSLVEAKIIEAFLRLGMWAFASFLVYGVYVGWIARARAEKENLMTLLKSIALYNGRTRVNKEDFNEFRRLWRYINFNFNYFKLDDTVDMEAE